LPLGPCPSLPTCPDLLEHSAASEEMTAVIRGLFR
jgi:hypothetical protein